MKISQIPNEQFTMNQAKEILFTSLIMINSYKFPKMYDRKKLIHFIDDLVEDTFE
jgi:hypothetical protein